MLQCWMFIDMLQLHRIDSVMEVLTMDIKKEALYFPKSLGFVKVPGKHTEFWEINEGLPMLFTAQVRVSLMLLFLFFYTV